jgi:phosphate:Na+ symporter
VSEAAALLGGLGLFLLGMTMMTEGLTRAAGGALQRVLDSWTATRLRGLLTGMAITAVVQSSTAVTVATVGFASAGLLTLHQAVWLVFGTNIGTTVTGWLVALVGVKVDVGRLALPLLGMGMLLRLAVRRQARWSGAGMALAGFGAFFLGVATLQAGFVEVAPLFTGLDLPESGWLGRLGFVMLGILLTSLTQSSSAAIAITLTASASGNLPAEMAAAVVVGTNIGTTSTAVLAALGAGPMARRVAGAHVAFNLLTAAVALLALPWLLAAAQAVAGLAGGQANLPAQLAVFHTLFNCVGLALILCVADRLVALLIRLFPVPAEEIGRPQHLDPTLLPVPEVALHGVLREIARLRAIAAALAIEFLRPSRSFAAELAARQEGVLRLGAAIRDFIARLGGAAPLPPAVADALPDLLRAVQHLETVAATAGEVIGQAPPATHPLAISATAALRREVLEVLAAPDKADAAASEALYQTAKTDLLRAAASGRMPVAAMDEALAQARLLREIADAAAKARLRLAPWLGAAG